MAALANNYDPYPITFVKGLGALLWDRECKSYLDFMSAYSAVSCGHCHPRLVSALIRQASTLSMTSRAYHNDSLDWLAETLTYLTGFDTMLPMNTGAEAVETAIKAARKWAYEKKGVPKDLAKIIVAENNFHGRTTTIVGFSSDRDNEAFGPATSGFIRVRFGDAAHLRTIAEIHRKNLAAILIEPIQGEAGIIVPPDGYLTEVRKICNAVNAKFILDEVQSGLGRTGEWLAAYHEPDCEPDAILLGKALGGGMVPISCMLGTEDFMSVFTPGCHGSTFGGNQLACAVATETINVMRDEGLITKSANLGHAMLHNLRKELKDCGRVADIRGRGLWAGIELTEPAKPYCLKLLEEGVVTKDTHTNVIRIAPPLVISSAELEQGIGAVVDVLRG